MNKLHKVSLIFLFFALFIQQNCFGEKVWQRLDSEVKDSEIISISVFSGNDSFICAASENCVYLSKDAGDSWKEVFSLKVATGEINFVAFDCLDEETLYLATTEGLFIRKDQRWQKVFSKPSEEANNVLRIAPACFDSRKLYIGTKEGLYFSQDKAQTWKRLKGGLPRSEIRSIAAHTDNSFVLYLANTYGLFKSTDVGRSWRRIYVTSYKVSDEEEEESDEEEDSQNLINCIAIDRTDPRRVFIATGKGVLVSPDAGESWNRLPSRGLVCDYVNFIVISSKKGTLYAATNNGVFKFSPQSDSWQEIYQGMTGRNVYSLALGMDEEHLFAATDKGIFNTVRAKDIQKQKVKKEKDKPALEQVLKELTLKEPTIREVQEAAIRYAEVVHPKVFKALRRDSRLRGFLPTISLDYDKTVYGSSNNKVGFVGPRDWGLSFSWDVGELLFSEQTRLVDSNIRLAVQLRDDILDEVTRLYYERRKLQTELIVRPPKKTEDKLAQTLRLQELTANIDALTGGYFSRQLKMANCK
ncbi:MAG: hypothetical protein JSV30_00950 [Candidatus Omnitrophota bacterium]|nr:MAG: hypothetical protein JSV30_00950 [Candidatus Omnitrophota bacterium]